MIVDDLESAAGWLKRIGYYRFSRYAYPFRKSHVQSDPVTGIRKVIISEDFQAGTTFQQVVNLYLFDKNLRALYLDAIEVIEVGLRVEIALLLGARNPFAHLDPNQFDAKFSFVPSPVDSRYAKWSWKLADKFRDSNEDFVKHFKAKYQGDLPIWMSIELWDFGMMSMLLDGMKTVDKARISAQFGLIRTNILPSWTRNLNVVRNICAHHGRLWNRSLVTVLPKLPQPGEVTVFDHLVADRGAQARAYTPAALLQYLQRVIYPVNDWSERLKTLMATFPRSGGVNAAQAGFPKNWEHLPLWQ
jgi:abortive infection bacteriophage resistance protein